MSDQYFVSSPQSQANEHEMDVVLAGKSRQVAVASGVFSAGRLDKGTAELLDFVPPLAPSLNAPVLDIGCGWGPIALTLALQAPQAPVYAVDVNERALALTARNAERLGLGNIHAKLPQDVPAELEFAEIWSNPPIRVGKPALHDLLMLWLPRLALGGVAWLVVSKNLGADSLLTWLNENLPGGFTATREKTSAGYRIIRVLRS